MTMTIEKMEKVGEWLKNATPEQLDKMAHDMAEKAPHLLPLAMTEKEKVEGFIQMNINSIDPTQVKHLVDFESGYVQGLIDSAMLSGLLSNEESEHYHRLAVEKRNS